MNHELSREEMGQEQEICTLGGGCFWCLEAVFVELQGVEKVVSGYAGGSVPSPTYREVCNGTTGHAEVAQVVFDPDCDLLPRDLAGFLRYPRSDDAEPAGCRCRNSVPVGHFLSQPGTKRNGRSGHRRVK